MDEAVARSQEVHESAEIDDLDDLARIDHADLRFGYNAADPVDRRLRRLGVYRGDLDRAVVVDIDLGAGRLDDLANDLAAGADDLADLVARDRECRDPRRVLADFLARPGQRLRHLAEDVAASVFRLIERDAHYLLGDRGDLDVHLQRRDAALGAGDLKVHIAEMVFVAENVRQHGKAVLLLDQPHRDPGDRARQRHAGIHQRERRAAHARHRGRAVRLGDLGDDADRIGETVFWRQQWPYGAPGELAVADLAPSGRTHTAGFAGRIRWEVVVQDKAFAVFAFKRVDDLLVLSGTECRDHQCLRLTACEQNRAVRPRQEADLAIDRPYCSRVAPVDPGSIAQDGAAHDLLFDILEQLHRKRPLLVILEQGDDAVLGCVKPIAALLLAAFAIGRLDLRSDGLAQPGLDLALVGGRLGKAPRLFGAGLGQFDNRVDDRLEALVPERDRAEHNLLG